MKPLLALLASLSIGGCAGSATPASPSPQRPAPAASSPGTAAAISAENAAAALAGSAAQPAQDDSAGHFPVVNEPGVLIDIADVLVADKVTVVEFFADWCAPCKTWEAQMAARIRGEPRIAVRKIDIADDTSEVARHYDIGLLPHVRIYSPTGELLHTLIGPETDKSAQLARAALSPP